MAVYLQELAGYLDAGLTREATEVAEWNWIQFGLTFAMLCGFCV